MDRKKQSLKAGVVGLSAAEQRQVRGGRTSMTMGYRFYLLNYRRNTRYNLTWMSGSGSRPS